MTPRLSMRRAAETDLPAILRLLADDDLGRERDDPDDAGDPAYRAALAAIDRDPNQLLAVAELDGAVVGTLQLTFLPGLSNRGAWRCMVEAVRVDAAQRGQGLGAEMMDWAVSRARARGCATVQLGSHLSREAAHRFYERIGFVRSHAMFKKSV
ncbi:GNAT family N-acetyltransferase [Rhodobacterales bacterium HKCCE2091]|nr:GNAT family N-acetyltransferase [Rhodobacterales bacterium HKCCE2091]